MRTPLTPLRDLIGVMILLVTVVVIPIWIDRLDTNTLYLKAQLEELQAKHNLLVEVTRKEIERCHTLRSQ